MKVMPYLGDWDFCRKFDCHDSDARPFLIGRNHAVSWLRRYKNDVPTLAAMRKLLLEAQIGANSPRMSDDAVIDQIAELLAAGRLHIHVHPMKPTMGPSTGSGPSQPSFPLSERKPKATTSSHKVQAPPDPPTFPVNVDAAAQAETLRTAAQQGTPFCEVCAAMAAAQAASRN